MKITFNIEKKHLYFLIGFILFVGIGVVIATGYNGEQSHSTLFTDMIRSRGSDTVTVNDKLGVAGSGTILRLQATAVGDYPRMLFAAGTGSVGGVINRDAAKDIYFGESTDTGKWIFRSSGAMTIEGNVGIGTATPTQKLDVFDGVGWFRRSANGMQTALQLGRMDNSVTTPLYLIQADDTNGDILRIYSQRWGGDVRFDRSSSGGDRRMVSISGYDSGHVIDLYSGVGVLNSRLNSNGDSYLMGGNVGIGTTTPTQRLDVAGNVKGTGFCIGTECRTGLWPTSSLSGGGPTNYIAKWLGTNSIGGSSITDNGVSVVIGGSLEAYENVKAWKDVTILGNLVVAQRNRAEGPPFGVGVTSCDPEDNSDIRCNTFALGNHYCQAGKYVCGISTQSWNCNGQTDNCYDVVPICCN